MSVPLAVTNNDLWTVSLVIGLVAALIVAVLLILLVRAVVTSTSRSTSLLEVAGKVAGNTAHIPRSQATAPVLGLIVEEAVVQDGYMNALTDGYGGVPHEHLDARGPERPARRRRRRGARRAR